jgi:hypothetical protein
MDRLEKFGINRAWIEADAAMPLEWELRGLVLGPRVADPAIQDAQWVAWARPKEGSKDEASVRLRAAASRRIRRLTTLPSASGRCGPR